MELRDNERAALLMIRGALHGLDSLPEEERAWLCAPRDWAGVLQELADHAVASLVEPVVSALRPGDGPAWQVWSQRFLQMQAHWYQVSYAQGELLALLEEQGIPCVILKGMAAGRYYPDPALRASGDVDFLVREADFQAADALLRAHGYRVTLTDEEFDHHIAYAKYGICFELHRRPGGMDRTDKALIDAFGAGIGQRTWAATGSYTYPVLPERLNGTVLLLHIKQHLLTGIGLKQVVDWLLFAEKRLSDAAWREEYGPWFTSLGLDTFAVTVTYMCRKYLGLRPDIHWCDGADEGLCDELMAYIVSRGSFGIKQNEEGEVLTFAAKTGGPVRLFKRLQKFGRMRLEASGKSPLLRPFAWALQLGHIAKTLKQRKLAPRELLKTYRSGGRTRRLMEELGLRDL